MTNRELLTRRTVFEICLGMSIVAGLWSAGWYSAASMIFSDLTHYGIEYRGDVYREIVATTEQHTMFVCGPIAVVLLVSLIAWGVQVRQDVRAMREHLSMTADGKQ